MVQSMVAVRSGDHRPRHHVVAAALLLPPVRGGCDMLWVQSAVSSQAQIRWSVADVWLMMSTVGRAELATWRFRNKCSAVQDRR